MPITLEEIEENVGLLDKPTMKLTFPVVTKAPVKKTRLHPADTITGKRYDIVLACQPNAQDNYPLYDRVVDLVEKRKNFKIYSPHNDKNKDVITFITREAIPRTRGVLVHLSIISPEIQEMFEAVYRCGKPFFLFYHSDINPFGADGGFEIRTQSHYVGEITYDSEDSAIQLLNYRIDELLRAS